MALALYRKYRPQTFAEVIGQEHVTEPLSQALRSGRLHHAYLFSGPRGCGKTSSARILARSLNCERGPTPEPCGECASCRALATDGPGSIDVIEIDAASHGGVDDARELRERAFFAPATSRYKIYVIDEAHMVSSAGFNALLKLVEEPPDYVKFVFATTEPEKVLGTIKSRTHHYPFRLIPPGVLRPYLEQLCETEGVRVEPTVFPLIVRAGGGSARDSLSVLDQLISGAGPEGVRYARAVALLGVTDVALIDEMCDALAAGDGAAAYVTVDRVVEAGHDPRRFASDLLERLRDLIVLQQVPDARDKGLIDAPSDQLERMAAQAQRLGPATLSRCADIVHEGLVEMRGTTSPRLLLELLCARMLLPGAEDGTGSLLQRLERLERRLTLTAPAEGSGRVEAPPPAAGPDLTDSAVRAAPVPPRPRPIEAPAPAASPEPPADREAPAAPPSTVPDVPESTVPDAPQSTVRDVPGQLDAAAVRRVWDEILTMLANRSKRAAAVVREATVRDVDGDTLVLTFRHSVHANMLSASPELLLEAVYEVLGGRWQIRCELAGDQRSEPAVAPAAAPRGPAPGAGQPDAVDAPGAREARGGGAGPAGPAGGNPASRPGGVRQSRPADPPTAGNDTETEADWPELARLGGPAPAAAGTPAPGPAARPVPAGPGARPAGKRAAARPAGTGRGSTGSAPGRPGARPAGGVWDVPPPDEAPYDPDYDPPVRDGSAYEGFDPGDEPLDDAADEQAVRQTSEQQALELLQQALGAEKIGEIEAR